MSEKTDNTLTINPEAEEAKLSPSPNTSLVCGIISIVAASTIVPGFVLGLISLVSASNYKKAGGNHQMSELERLAAS